MNITIRKTFIIVSLLFISIVIILLLSKKEYWPDEKIAPPTYSLALEKLSQGKTKEGLNILESLLRNYKSPIWEKRWNFLIGYWLLKQGKEKKALNKFQKSYSEEDPLHSLALYHGALSAMKAKKEQTAMELLRVLLKKNHAHPYRIEGILLLIEVLIHKGELEEARKTLLQYRNQLKKDHFSTLLFKLAVIDEKEGKKSKAFERYKKIYCLYPFSPESSELEKSLGLAEDQRTLWGTDEIILLLKRGEILEKHSKFSEALHLYLSIQKLFPECSKNPEFTLRLGRTLYNLGNMKEAHAHLKLIREKGNLASEARYLLARIYLNKGNTRAFKREMKILASSEKRTEIRAKSLITLAEYFDTRGKWSQALPYYQKYIALYPSGEKIRKVLWRTGLIYYLNKRYRNAFSVFSKIINEKGNPYHKPATFWAGKCQEKLKNKKRALELYSIIMANAKLEYYGIKAKERFMKLSQRQRKNLMPKQRPLASPEIPPFLAQDFAAAQELIILDLKDIALKYLQFICLKKSKHHIEPFLKASEIALELDDPEYAADFIRKGLSHSSSTLEEIPPSFLKLLYPLIETLNICQMAERFSLDCLLVHAIILQESNFNSRAVSRSGAMGLMQIMPDTGEDISKKIQKQDHSDSKLFDPDYNMLLGCSHFSHLMKKSNNSLEFSLAAYNAGEASAKKWKRWLHGHDSEEYIDNIPYFETRNYIKKIISHYEIYSKLYGI